MKSIAPDKPKMRLLHQVARGNDMPVSQNLHSSSSDVDSAHHEETFEWKEHIHETPAEQSLNNTDKDFKEDSSAAYKEKAFDLKLSEAPEVPDSTQDDMTSENHVIYKTIVQPNQNNTDASELTHTENNFTTNIENKEILLESNDNSIIENTSDIINSDSSETPETLNTDEKRSNFTQLNANDFNNDKKQKPKTILEPIFNNSKNNLPKHQKETIKPFETNSGLLNIKSDIEKQNSVKTNLSEINKTEKFDDSTIFSPDIADSSRIISIKEKQNAETPTSGSAPENKTIADSPGFLKITKDIKISKSIAENENLSSAKTMNTKKSKTEQPAGKVKINNININVRKKERSSTPSSLTPQYADHIITENWDGSCQYIK